MSNTAFAGDVYASFESGKLKLLIPASKLVSRIDHFLNNSNLIPTTLVDSRTRKGSIRYFRTSFMQGKIRIRFDYSFKDRECNKKPVGDGWWCTPWIRDSGWAEADLRTSIVNWKFSANTRSGHARWDSNNWFTQTFIHQFVDNEIRTIISDAINYGIESILGEGSLDLKRLVVNEGSLVIARSFRISEQEARDLLKNTLNNVTLNSHINSDGLYLTLRVSNSPARKMQFHYFCFDAKSLTCENRIRSVMASEDDLNDMQFYYWLDNGCRSIGYESATNVGDYHTMVDLHRDSSKVCRYFRN